MADKRKQRRQAQLTLEVGRRRSFYRTAMMIATLGAWLVGTVISYGPFVHLLTEIGISIYGALMLFTVAFATVGTVLFMVVGKLLKEVS